MKNLLGTFATVLLIAVALTTFARRDNSGWIAFEAVEDELPALFLMNGNGSSRHSITPRSICGTSPQWSPDGKWIGFTNPCSSTNDFLLINASGSDVRNYLAPEFTISDFAWSSDGDLAYLGGCICQNNVQLTIKETTGDERLLTSGYSAVFWPPHSKWIYAVPNNVLESSLDRIHAETGRTETLLPPGNLNVNPSWSPDGAQAVIAMSTDSGDELFVMSQDGSSLVMISEDLPPPRLRMPRWSPDGERIAFWGGEPSAWRVWRIQSDGRDLRELSNSIRSLNNLQWSLDGNWLLFSAEHDNQRSIFRLRADGTRIENLGPGDNPQYAPAAGLDWRPLWLTIAAMGMMLVSLKGSGA